jgi:hypothetical protein
MWAEGLLLDNNFRLGGDTGVLFIAECRDVKPHLRVLAGHH